MNRNGEDSVSFAATGRSSKALPPWNHESHHALPRLHQHGATQIPPRSPRPTACHRQHSQTRSMRECSSPPLLPHLLPEEPGCGDPAWAAASCCFVPASLVSENLWCLCLSLLPLPSHTPNPSLNHLPKLKTPTLSLTKTFPFTASPCASEHPPAWAPCR
jgi:hypothetical protein